MTAFNLSLRNMTSIEDIASGETLVHRISPEVKMVFTLFYIVTVISFPLYDWSGLIPFFCYPAAAVILSQIPPVLLIKRITLALPFVCFAGIANILLDKTQIPFGPELTVPGGIISFAVLLMKTILSVGAVLILAATTPVNTIAGTLKKFHVPCLIILQLLLTWRYLSVLIEEAGNILTAYRLRSSAYSAVKFRDWPSLVGQLLIKSINRAERIFQAMQCRLFDARNIWIYENESSWKEMTACGLLCVLCVLLRLYNFSEIIGSILL